jgi:hypothetical protein
MIVPALSQGGGGASLEPHGYGVLGILAVVFNNNARDYALRNAQRFTELLSAAGSPQRARGGSR